MNKETHSNSGFGFRRGVCRAACLGAMAIVVCGALLWNTGRLAAQTNGVWNVTTSGSAAGTNLWSSAANWQGSKIADGTDAIADFSQLTLPGDETVHLDSPHTVGALIFADANYSSNWTLDNNQQSANTLTLASTVGQPTITINSIASISAVLAGNQGFTLNPDGIIGTLYLSGANTYTGPTVINTQTLSITAEANLGAGGPIINGGTLQATGNVTLSAAHPIANAYGTIDVADGCTLTCNGVISGNGLGFTGSGTLILAGANTYSGPTTIGTGTLQTAAINTIPASSDVAVPSGATLMLSGFSQTVGGLSGSGSITNNGVAPATLTIGQTSNGVSNANTFSGVISDMPTGVTAKLSLTKVSFAIQTLTGTNTYTGPTTIDGGALVLDYSNPAAPTTIINSASPLILGGGILAIVDRTNSTATVQKFNGTTINAGASFVNPELTHSGSTLVLGSLTRNPGGTVAFALPSAGNITTTTPNTDGIIGAWATVSLQNIQNPGGGDWAANSGVVNAAGGNNIVAYSGYSYDYANTIPTANYGWAPGNNTSTIASGTDAIASGSTTNSLRFGPASNCVITLTGHNTITSGGILVADTGTNGQYGIAINGSGSLTAGTTADELMVTMFNQSASIEPGFDPELEIEAAIVDNGSGPLGLTLSGGALTLSNAANSYTGATRIFGGQLVISADHDLGVPPATPKAGDLVLAGGSLPSPYNLPSGTVLQTTGTFTLNANRGIALGPGYQSQFGWLGATVNVQGGTVTYGGTIADAGASPGALLLTGGGTLVLTGTNTFSGGVIIESGVLEISSDAALGAASVNSTITFFSDAQGNATLQLAPNFSGSITSGRAIVVGGQDYGTIDTNGNGTATTPITFAGNLILGGMDIFGNTQPAVFIKAGSGVFEIDSAPSLFGSSSFVVGGGTLRLNYSSAPSILSGSKLSVSAGAALDLAGSVSQLSQTVNIANSGTLFVTSAVNQNVGTITGGGDVVVSHGGLTAYQLIQNSLTITGNATVALLPSGSGSTSAPVNPNNTKFSSFLYTLSIAGTTNAWTGTLDIGNNGLVIAYENNPDPYAAIVNMIRSGYAEGLWTGTGITSSLAAASLATNTPLNIGIVDFTPNANGFGSSITFEGQILTTSAVLVRLTYMDDLVLAGDMQFANAASDALYFAANYGTGTTWNVGDLNHDGVIDTSDALLFAANYAVGLPSLDGSTGNAAALGGASAAVPEPSSFVLAGLGLLMLLHRRRADCRSGTPVPDLRGQPAIPRTRDQGQARECLTYVNLANNARRF